MTPPPSPLNARATVTGGSQVNLVWDAAIDPESGVDHYLVYRDGQAYGTATTTGFTDTSNVSPSARHAYQVSAVNYDGFEGPRSAAVSVVPVGLASVSAAESTRVRVVFTEPVDLATAQTAANYQIPGVTVSSAALESDHFTVTLTTSALGSSSHTLTVINMRTLEGSLLPSLQGSFAYGGTIDYDYWLNIGYGVAVSDLTSNPNYPNNPTGHQYLTSFDAPHDWADGYGGRIRGYVLPPATDNYTFWIASDDNGELWLSTDDNPANKVKIAYVPGWTSWQAWTWYPAQQQSALIPLVAGQRYYIEALQKEGGGGDNLSVAWQRQGGAFQGPIPGSYLAPYSGSTVTPAPWNTSTCWSARPSESGRTATESGSLVGPRPMSRRSGRTSSTRPCPRWRSACGRTSC
jgi:hypothetical protein